MVRILAILFILLLSAPVTGQLTEPERIATLESDMRNVKEIVARIETKIDDAAAKESANADSGAIVSDRFLMELLVILIVGGDKASFYYRNKRRNGSWTKPGNGEKVT